MVFVPPPPSTLRKQNSSLSSSSAARHYNGGGVAGSSSAKQFPNHNKQPASSITVVQNAYHQINTTRQQSTYITLENHSQQISQWLNEQVQAYKNKILPLNQRQQQNQQQYDKSVNVGNNDKENVASNSNSPKKKQDKQGMGKPLGDRNKNSNSTTNKVEQQQQQKQRDENSFTKTTPSITVPNNNDVGNDEELLPSPITNKIQAYRVVELRKELRNRGLDTSGLKKELKTRLLNAMYQEEEEKRNKNQQQNNHQQEHHQSSSIGSKENNKMDSTITHDNKILQHKNEQEQEQEQQSNKDSLQAELSIESETNNNDIEEKQTKLECEIADKKQNNAYATKNDNCDRKADNEIDNNKLSNMGSDNNNKSQSSKDNENTDSQIEDKNNENDNDGSSNETDNRAEISESGLEPILEVSTKEEEDVNYMEDCANTVTSSVTSLFADLRHGKIVTNTKAKVEEPTKESVVASVGKRSFEEVLKSPEQKNKQRDIANSSPLRCVQSALNVFSKSPTPTTPAIKSSSTKPKIKSSSKLVQKWLSATKSSSAVKRKPEYGDLTDNADDTVRLINQPAAAFSCGKQTDNNSVIQTASVLSSAAKAKTEARKAKNDARKAKIAEMRNKSKPVTSTTSANTVPKEFSATLSSLKAKNTAAFSEGKEGKRKLLAEKMREKAAENFKKTNVINLVDVEESGVPSLEMANPICPITETTIKKNEPEQQQTCVTKESTTSKNDVGQFKDTNHDKQMIPAAKKIVSAIKDQTFNGKIENKPMMSAAKKFAGAPKDQMFTGTMTHLKKGDNHYSVNKKCIDLNTSTSTAATTTSKATDSHQRNDLLSPMSTYEISDREESDSDESDSEDDSNQPKKKVPGWARQANLIAALEKQYAGDKCDPDEIFPEVQTCDLQAIFESKKTKYSRRTSTGNWTKDRLTAAEKLTYKRTMGFSKSKK